MAEPPDFERLADVCLARVYEAKRDGLIAEHSVVVEQLRQIWNARGAADIEQLNVLNEFMPEGGLNIVQNLAGWLRKLDR